MYLISQNIANRIAGSQQLSSEVMKRWFQATEEEVKTFEKELEDEVYLQTGSSQISRAVTAYLPIAAENEAITEFIKQTKDYILRVQIPEVFTAKEAGLYAQLEFLMNHEQTTKAIQVIDYYLNDLKKSHLVKS